MKIVNSIDESSYNLHNNICKTNNTDEWLFLEKDYESKSGEWFLIV